MASATPNLHHLELFYHVARAGGITPAVRAMPYGIQQPAVSGQISRLEKELGVRLFQRRPFQLTHAGRELFGFVAPFFGALPDMAEKIAGKAARHLRMAAPSVVVRDHLPHVLADLKKDLPDLEVTLMEGGHRNSISLLEREEIDLAIAEIEGRAPSGVHAEVLVKLPLVLLLPPGMKAPGRGWQDLVGREPLIRSPLDTVMSRLFQKGMARRGLNWESRIEVHELDTVHEYVACGFGVGLTVQVPGVAFPAGTQAVPLKGFPELDVAALWRGRRSVLAEAVVAGLKRRVPVPTTAQRGQRRKR